MIVQWCNGSTAVFGTACGGSSPPWTTQQKPLKGGFCCVYTIPSRHRKHTSKPHVFLHKKFIYIFYKFLS